MSAHKTPAKRFQFLALAFRPSNAGNGQIYYILGTLVKMAFRGEKAFTYANTNAHARI